MKAPRRAAQLGVTDADYARLEAEHGGACGICRGTPKRLKNDGSVYRLQVDHDHSRGARSRVRGLLCAPCNRRLAKGITWKWCLAAAAYLLRAQLRGVAP